MRYASREYGFECHCLGKKSTRFVTVSKKIQRERQTTAPMRSDGVPSNPGDMFRSLHETSQAVCHHLMGFSPVPHRDFKSVIPLPLQSNREFIQKIPSFSDTEEVIGMPSGLDNTSTSVHLAIKTGFTAYDKNGLRVEVAFDRVANDPNWLFAKLTATPHVQSVVDLLFHVTVPGFQFVMFSASGRLATPSNPVTQVLHIFDPKRAALKMGINLCLTKEGDEFIQDEFEITIKHTRKLNSSPATARMTERDDELIPEIHSISNTDEKVVEKPSGLDITGSSAHMANTIGVAVYDNNGLRVEMAFPKPADYPNLDY